MKRLLILSALFALGLLLLVGTGPGKGHKFIESAEASSVEEIEGADVDSGRLGRLNLLSFKDYLRRREGMVAMLRGLPDGNALDARLQALQLLEQQEALLQDAVSASGSGSLTGTGGGGNQSGSSPNNIKWTPLGPSPIPDGQTNYTPTGDLDPGGVRNPVSGRVLAIAVHPTNPDIVYVGTAQGGLYRTSDGGRTWTPLMDKALSLSVGAITIDPMEPSTLFVGTGEGNFCADCYFGVGFYIIKKADTNPKLLGPYNNATNTTNGSLAKSRSITKIAVVPNDHNTIFVATGSGVNGINGGGGLGPDPTARGLFRCSNVMSGSPSCTKLNVNGPNGGLNTAVRDIVFEPGNPNNLIVGVDDSIGGGTNGIYRTTNALATDPSAITFTRTLTTAEFTSVQLAVNKTGNTVTVYAATEDDGNGDVTGTVRKSVDGGVTWSDPVSSSATGFCGTQCWYDMPIAVDPTNANNVYIGGAGDYDSTMSAFKRTNDGVNFSKSATGLHPDTHVITVAPSNPSVIYTGDDGGIFKSTDAGAHWTSINTAGLNATQFVSLALHPTDRNFLIGGTQDNGTPFLQSNSVWKLGDYGDGGYALIDKNATDTGASVTAYHTYYNAQAVLIGFSRADGASQIDPTKGWQTFYGCYAGVALGVVYNGINCADSVLFYAPMAQGPGNPNTIYFGTDHLYRSEDQGNTMVPVSQVFETNVSTTVTTAVNSPVSAIGISPQNDNVRIVGITSGRVFATTTGAPVMTEITPPVTPRKFIGRAVIDPNNPRTAYVTLVGYGVPAGQHIWKTTNLDTSIGAQPVSWSPAGNGLPDVPVDAFVVDPQNSNTLYAGTDIGVYRSTDGGANWQPFSNGLPRVAIFDMAIQNNNRLLRIATHGRGIWEISLNK